MSIINLHNYRDRNYRYVVLSCILSMILLGDILSPILNYTALNLPKNSPNFNNYATIASIAPGLPFMLSVVISYFINNIGYRILILSVFIITASLTIFMFSLSLINFLSLTVIIVMISFLYRTLYFSLDRQLSTIIVDKIHDFQSDLVIWGGIIGAVGMKLSGYLYNEFHLKGIIWCFLLGNIILFYFMRQIPPVLQVEKINRNDKKILSLKKVTRILCNYPSFLKYILLVLIIMLLGGSLNILLMAKIHHEKNVVSHYVNLIALSMLLGIIGGIASKNRWLKNIPAHKTITISVSLNSILLICLGLTANSVVFDSCYLASTAISTISFININSVIFRHIRKNIDLVQISPFINGLIASLFYLSSLLGQLLTNFALNHSLSYQSVYIIVGTTSIACSVILFGLRDQPTNQ